MTDIYMEKMIKESMRNAAVPENIANCIRQTTEMITDRTERVASDVHEGKGRIKNKRLVHENTTVTRKNRKVRPWWQIPVAAAAVLFCTGITVYAAAKLYQFRVEQKETHQVAVGVTATQGDMTETLPGTGDIISVTEVPAVTMNVSYLPEGLIDNSAQKGSEAGGSYIQEDENGGYFINQPRVMDMTESSWTQNFVTEHEMISVGGRDCLYIATQNGTDANWIWKDLCIPFPEFNRIVLVQAWGYAPKEELIKIAEGISLTPAGGTESAAGLDLWSDYVAYKSTDMADDESEEHQYRYTASKEEMQNLHEVGETYVSIFSDDYRGLEIRVADVQITDNAALLRGDITEGAWKALIMPDGTFGQATREYYREGDGVNTLSEVVRTEDVDMKLVFVTLEYINTGNTDMENVYYWASLEQIEEKGGMYMFVEHMSEDADWWDYNPATLGTGEMFYYDVGNGQRKNYIPSIRAGESQTVHVAWLVGEDETDNLYLSTCDYGQFTDNMLKEGLVKIY